MESITIDKQVITDLSKMVEELQNKIESLELASNPELMESLKRSKEQIEKGDLVNFDDL